MKFHGIAILSFCIVVFVLSAVKKRRKENVLYRLWKPGSVIVENGDVFVVGVMCVCTIKHQESTV